MRIDPKPTPDIKQKSPASRARRGMSIAVASQQSSHGHAIEPVRNHSPRHRISMNLRTEWNCKDYRVYKYH